MRASTAADLELESELRLAVDRGELTVSYQPQVDAATRDLVGAEALLRWELDGEPVSPDRFVPLAERSGLIDRLGLWVLEEAIEALLLWDEEVPGNRLAVTVNLSGRQLADPRLAEHVAEVLGRHAIEPARILLEITETVLISDARSAAERLLRLRELGVRIAIDDFGTGYASLEYLRRFPMAEVLKIDRTFVRGVAQPGTDDAAIVAAAVELARTLGMTTVAEGVETAAQAAVLAELGCDRLQGSVFGPTLAAADVAGRLRDALATPG